MKDEMGETQYFVIAEARIFEGLIYDPGTSDPEGFISSVWLSVA